MRWLALVSLLFLGACGFCDEFPVDADERIVARARALVLASELALTAAEREAVLTTQPETLYYRAFGPCQLEQAYIINWHLPEGTIQVHGIGNVLTLEGAEVRRVAKEGEIGERYRSRRAAPAIAQGLYRLPRCAGSD